MIIDRNKFPNLQAIWGNKCPVIGEGMIEPKNANCERGIKQSNWRFCSHKLDSHEIELTAVGHKIVGETRPRCRSALKS